jgi:hypothetical protein
MTGVGSDKVGTAAVHQNVRHRVHSMIGASAAPMRADLRLCDHAAERLAEPRLLHARDDVLPAIRGKDRRPSRLRPPPRSAADRRLDEVVRIRRRLRLQDSIDRADERDQIVDRRVRGPAP